MHVAGWSVTVTYLPHDEKYDISINGVSHKDMLAVAPEPRELSKIYRIKKGTEEDEKELRTFFLMLIDGEVVPLIISYCGENR